MLRFKLFGKEEFKQIDSICLFKDQIPPLTESSENVNGGQYHYSWMELKPSEIEGLWLELCVSLVTNEGISHIENVFYFFFFERIHNYYKINGIRLCDKSKPPKNFSVRLEIWLNIDLTDANSLVIHNEIKADIIAILKKHSPKFEQMYKSSKK